MRSGLFSLKPCLASSHCSLCDSNTRNYREQIDNVYNYRLGACPNESITCGAHRRHSPSLERTTLPTLIRFSSKRPHNSPLNTAHRSQWFWEDVSFDSRRSLFHLIKAYKNTNQKTSSSAAHPLLKHTPLKPPSPPNATSQSARSPPQTNTAPSTTPQTSRTKSSFSSTRQATGNCDTMPWPTSPTPRTSRA